MFNFVKTPLALAAIAFVSAACSSGTSSMSVPAASSPAPTASLGSPSSVYTNVPSAQTAPAGTYVQPATYASSQPTIYSTTPTASYTTAQPALTQSAQFPAIGQTSIQPASTATFSGTPSYQTMPLQTPGYAAPSLPSVPAGGSEAMLQPVLPGQSGGASLLQTGASTAQAVNSGATAESLMIQGANTAVNYGANQLIN